MTIPIVHFLVLQLQLKNTYTKSVFSICTFTKNYFINCRQGNVSAEPPSLQLSPTHDITLAMTSVQKCASSSSVLVLVLHTHTHTHTHAHTHTRTHAHTHARTHTHTHTELYSHSPDYPIFGYTTFCFIGYSHTTWYLQCCGAQSKTRIIGTANNPELSKP